jgi:L-seryl-tRNA(Ser) seleniumtransferase
VTESWREKLYRDIPKVDEFLEKDIVKSSLSAHPRWVVLDTVREVLEKRRSAIARLGGPETAVDTEGGSSLEGDFTALLSARALPRLRTLINATGIIVHTNLGRSSLPAAALEQASAVGAAYSTLEYDLSAGERGSRQDHVADLLCRLTGAEAALAVNNNAAAVMLCLGTLAEGREVVVSRGQLVEIGGSFRIPDVMTRSGALMREVGTTNKTHLPDYRNAIGPETALLLKVHTSNFQVVGFTSSVSIADLVKLGREHAVPVMEDLGSGSLVDLSPYGLTGEPTVQSVVESGADVVTFSGDKLLGGPQAGLIVGRSVLLERIHRNPVHRAVRLDKMTLAALEATLRLYLEGDRALEKIPTLRMISEPLQKVRQRARRLYRRLGQECRHRLKAAVVSSAAQVGGGSLPLQEIASAALALGTSLHPAHALEETFRSLTVPVIGRIQEGRLLFDLRTVNDDEVQALAASIERAAQP